MTFLVGLTVGIAVGGSLGALIMAALLIGKVTDLQAKLDDVDTARWRDHATY